MDFLEKKNGEVILLGDANDPRVWGLYKFEPIPSIYDASPLDFKSKIEYAVVIGLSTIIYFGLCFLI